MPWPTIALIGSIAFLLFALTILYRFNTMGGPLGGFENDEFVTLSMAHQVTLGEQPMRDFVERGVPLTVALSVGALRAFGPTLFAEAILTSTLLGLSAALLFLLSDGASHIRSVPRAVLGKGITSRNCSGFWSQGLAGSILP